MKILFVVPYAPNLIRVRPYNLIRSLAARGNTVTVATLWSSLRERSDLQAFREEGIDVVAEPLPRWRSLWNCLRALPSGQPLQAHFCWSPHFWSRISNLELREYDVVHVEHLRGARYGLYIKSQIVSRDLQIPIVWDSVDCISYLFEQAARDSRSVFGKLVTRLDLPRTRRYEGWLVGQFDHMLVTSPIDRQALLDLGARFTGHESQITVLPNGVDLSYFAPASGLREMDALVFTGKMSYHANIAAALYLIEEIMPSVWARRPEVKVWIVGKDPPNKIRQLPVADGRLEVTGTVPDIRSYLCRAAVAVAPISYGVGIQNKVLEAMACGQPIVATPQAVSALKVVDGQHALVAAGPEVFAKAVLRLLDDTDLRQRLGEGGRRYVERYHAWSGIAQRLEEIYEAAMLRKRDQGGVSPVWPG